MARTFQLQSLEDEDASTWECVDTNGQITRWNTDPNKCLRGSYPLCGNCTNHNCFALAFDAGYVRHFIPSSKIPSEAIGKQVTLTLEAAMWKYSNSNPNSVYPIKIDIGPASFTYDMIVNITNSTCEGKHTSISWTFALPQPGPDGLNFTLWKANDPGYPTCLDIDNITLSYDPVADVAAAASPTVAEDPVPTQGYQLSTSGTGSSRNTGLAIALSVVAFALVVLAAGLLFWFCRRRKAKTPGVLPQEKEQGSHEKFTPPVIVASEVSSTVGTLLPIPGAPVELRPAPGLAVLENKTSEHPSEPSPTASEPNKIFQPTQEAVSPSQESILPSPEPALLSKKLIPSKPNPSSLSDEPVPLSDEPIPSSPIPTLPLQEQIPPPPATLPDKPSFPLGEPTSSSQQAVADAPSSDDTTVPKDSKLEAKVTGVHHNVPEIAAETKAEIEVATAGVERPRPRPRYQISRFAHQETRTAGANFQSSTSRTTRTTTFTSSSSIHIQSSRNHTVVKMSSSEEITHSG